MVQFLGAGSPARQEDQEPSVDIVAKPEVGTFLKFGIARNPGARDASYLVARCGLKSVVIRETDFAGCRKHTADPRKYLDNSTGLFALPGIWFLYRLLCIDEEQLKLVELMHPLIGVAPVFD